MSEATAGSLDGRRFRVESSNVIVEAREHDGIVWADLHGPLIAHGHATGVRRGSVVDYGFVVACDGTVRTGAGSARVVEHDDGSVTLDGDVTATEIGRAGTVLFVCTGNFYRSRFAELLFETRAAAAGLDWRAESRGLRAWSRGASGRMSPVTVEALGARGVRVRPGALRAPHLATPYDFERCTLAIALDETEHRPMVEEYLEKYADRFTFWSVPDMPAMQPDDALAQIERRVDALIASLV